LFLSLYISKGSDFLSQIASKNTPKEKSEETLLRMAKNMPQGSTIVGDSYFGSLPALELLTKEG